MGTIYVARSNTLGKWGSDVGLSKHIYKLGYSEGPVKAVLAAGWAGVSDWAIVKKAELEGGSEPELIQRAALKAKLIDPNLYPKLKGAQGVFKVLPAHVEDEIVVARAMAGEQSIDPLKLKPADFGAYLINSALK